MSAAVLEVVLGVLFFTTLVWAAATVAEHIIDEARHVYRYPST
jgi:hypothetical protein